MNEADYKLVIAILLGIIFIGLLKFSYESGFKKGYELGKVKGLYDCIGEI